MLDVSRSTVCVQSSHCVSGIGEPASRRASAEPGRWPAESLSANRRRRLEDEPVPACGAGALPGLCGVFPTNPWLGAAVGGRKRQIQRLRQTAADLQLFDWPRQEEVVKDNLGRVAACRRDPDG